MKLKIIQNSMAKYNLCSNEKSMSFYMIIEHNGKPLECDGEKCILHYSSSEDETQEFEYAINSLDYVFEKCFDYSRKIISSTDYEKQCLAFFKAYKEHHKELSESFISERKKQLEDAIEQLTQKLKNLQFPDFVEDIENVIQERIGALKKSIAIYENEKNDYKSDSPKVTEIEERIKRHNNKIIFLRSFIETD